MPPDLTWQQERFGEQLLLVVFPKMQVGLGRLVKCEDVICGFELGDSDEADLLDGASGGADCVGYAAEVFGEVRGALGVDLHFRFCHYLLLSCL